MAAAVMSPMANGLSMDGGIMAPSPMSPNNSRHGRSKHGGSTAKKTRGRGYSTVDERDVIVSKALSYVLKRTIEEGGEQDGAEEKLVADSEGWVDCEEVLAHPQLKSLEVAPDELRALIASTNSKSRFAIKQSDEEFFVRLNPDHKTPLSPTAVSAAKLTLLTTTTEDLPDLVVYETTYANYPLVLEFGGIKRAGGQAHLQFSSISIDEDGSEVQDKKSDADVRITIDLQSVMNADSSIQWFRSDNGTILSTGDSEGVVSKNHWKKVVARRADIGTLFEDGEVRKEVPVGLRGKGVKAKKGGKGKGKGGLKEMKTTRGSESEGEASE